MSIPRLMASSTSDRSFVESMPLVGAMPKMNASGTGPASSMASWRS